MRIMIDTNVLISIFLFPSPKLSSLVDVITERYTIVLELPFSLAYTPEKIVY